MRTTGAASSINYGGIKLARAVSHTVLLMHLLYLEIKLASLAEQIRFYNVEMCHGYPKKLTWDFSQRVKPATMGDKR